MQIKTEPIIWRLENLDEWGKEDFWWKNLLSSFKRRFKVYVPEMVGRLRHRMLMEDKLDERGFFLCIVKVFSRDAVLKPALIEEFIVLLLSDNDPFFKKVNKIIKEEL
ncbi:hypothetical protein HQ571_05795 [Candidatus Kuenenbacteria bacterium]|nr:hypothetical protein [Candidatus Kuenenbacteria bacterium]